MILGYLFFVKRVMVQMLVSSLLHPADHHRPHPQLVQASQKVA